MMEPQPRTLPKGWMETTLGAVAKDIVGGGTPSKRIEEHFQGKIPFMTVKDMTVSRPKDTIDHITEKALRESSAKLIPADTIIIATRMGLGKVVRTAFKTAINQDLKAIFPHDGVEKDFLEYWLRSMAVYLESRGTGTTVKGLRLELIRGLRFPLAPLNEQKRIIDKIETLFSDLDKGEENLRTAQRLIASYRQSVLKAAVTGELTRDWREANKRRLEPADKLLRRILQTRREQWKGRGKYQEPSAPNTAPLPKLPDEWVWTSIEQLFNVYVGSTPSRKEATYWNGNIPWVSSGEVAFCRIKDTKEKITQEGYDNSSVKLHPKGTVLLAMIGERKTRGQAAILDIEACHNQNAASIRVSETEIPPEYIYYLLLHNYEKNRLVGQGGNQPALNGLKVKKFTVPLPPLEEAREIVSRVEDICSQIATLEVWCATELARSVTLRQAILKSAFSGQLVPQDASDEPASELLKRIQAERASTPKAKSAAKRGRPGKKEAA